MTLRRNHDYKLIQTVEQLDEVCAELDRASTFAYDLETTGFSHLRDHIVGHAISVRERQGYYIPVAHTIGKQLAPSYVIERLKPYLEDPSKLKAIQNAKFDTRFTFKAGVRIPEASVADTMLEAFVAAEGDQRFGLDALSLRLFQVKLIKFDDLFPPRTKVKNIANVPLDMAAEYACEDADYTLRIHNRFYERVRNHFIFKLESQLWPVVQRIEDIGVKVDKEMMQIVSNSIIDQLKLVQEIIYQQVEQAVGRRIVFNISSSKALSQVLYDIMKLPVMVKTPGGAPATSELALDQLKAKYPICANILVYRSMVSNANNMGVTLVQTIDPDTGRIHTSYQQTGATTGRFASQKPNLQNVGKAKKWTVILPDGQKMEIVVYPRNNFVAEEDYYLLEFDFKAIELVVMADLAGETTVTAAYERNEDLHRITARDIFGVKLEDVTEEQRDLAKTLNYLIIYGGGGHGLAMRTAGKTTEEGEEDIRKYLRARPKFAVYMNNVRSKARITKRVSTYFGRSQVVPEYFEFGRAAQAKAERACVNRIIQGTAADIQKMGLIRTDKRLAEVYPRSKARNVLQTHDSQTWEVHRSIHPSEIIPLVTEAMSPPVRGLTRMKVDAKIGVCWGMMKGYTHNDDFDSQYEVMRDAFNEQKAKARASSIAGMQQLNLDLPEEPVALPAEPLPGRIIFEPGRPLENADARQIVDVLDAFPGKNIVVIRSADRDSPIAKHPTSLTAQTLTDAMSGIFPNGKATADREDLKRVVTAGLEATYARPNGEEDTAIAV